MNKSTFTEYYFPLKDQLKLSRQKYQFVNYNEINIFKHKPIVTSNQ